VVQEELAGGHVEHPRDQRDHRADWTDEAADDNAFTAVAAEKFLTAPQYIRIAAERPDAMQPVVKEPAEDKADAIAENGSDCGGQQGCFQAQQATAGERG